MVGWHLCLKHGNIHRSSKVRDMNANGRVNETDTKQMIPDNPNAGKGALIFISTFMVGIIITFIAFALFADVDALFNGGWGILEIGIYVLRWSGLFGQETGLYK